MLLPQPKVTRRFAVRMIFAVCLVLIGISFPECCFALYCITTAAEIKSFLYNCSTVLVIAGESDILIAT
jgi:hypothetical protein